MKTMRYGLTIHRPGDRSSVLKDFDATQPFMHIQAGDILNGGWLEGQHLRVTAIHHMILESDNFIRHTILADTEELK